MMKVNLEGKVALVTGAAPGIGQAAADAQAAIGAGVTYAEPDVATARQSAARSAGVLAVTDESRRRC